MSERITRRTDVEIEQLKRFSVALFLKSLRSGSPTYAGTVPAHVKASHRARNKVAGRSRRVNRVSAS